MIDVVVRIKVETRNGKECVKERERERFEGSRKGEEGRSKQGKSLTTSRPLGNPPQFHRSNV